MAGEGLADSEEAEHLFASQSEVVLNELFVDRPNNNPFVCGPDKTTEAGVDRLLGRRCIILFFGASWHDSSTEMHDHLLQLYHMEEAGSGQQDLEIVYIPDNNRDTADTNLAFTRAMPWLSTVFSDADHNAFLRRYGSMSAHTQLSQSQRLRSSLTMFALNPSSSS
jgi:hypothetical protein